MAHEANAMLRPERIEELAREIDATLAQDLTSLRMINTSTRLLSLNARIEAARAGKAGAAFAVVAENVMDLAKSMDASFHNLQTRTTPLLKELGIVGENLARDVRGKRLADLAATHLDLVDRNLYERSCDVRWWATEGALVAALETMADDDLAHASARMGQILDSYTVYFDLVLCDLSGRVVANGRPRQYSSKGFDASQKEWFRAAMATRSGSEFGFESVHPSPLAGGDRVLVYSTAVRRGGSESGEPIGALGVVFRWDALGQTIVENAALPPDEFERTLVLIVDTTGKYLASAGKEQIDSSLPWTKWLQQDQSARFYIPTELGQHHYIAAIARSQGYETYSTGWISALVQRVTG